MRLANIGHYADAGLNNGAQSGHLTGLRDAGFENAQLCLRVEQTNGQRNAYLRVVRAR